MPFRRPVLNPGLGEADLRDRLDPLPVHATKPKSTRKRRFAGEAIAARLHPADAMRLRTMLRATGLKMSVYVREAVSEKLKRDIENLETA